MPLQVQESFTHTAGFRHCLARGTDAARPRACSEFHHQDELQQGSAKTLPATEQAVKLTILMIKPTQDKVDANPSIDPCTRQKGSLQQHTKGNEAVFCGSSYLPVSLKSLLHVIWRRGNQTPGARFSPGPPGLQIAACEGAAEREMLRDLRQQHSFVGVQETPGSPATQPISSPQALLCTQRALEMRNYIYLFETSVQSVSSHLPPHVLKPSFCTLTAHPK